MAFYKDAKGKPKQEKKQEAQARGGFEDEGTEYAGRRGARSGAPRGAQRSYAPRGEGAQGGAPRGGQRSYAPRGEGAQGAPRGAQRSYAPRGEGAPRSGQYGDSPRSGQRSYAPRGEGAPRGGQRGYAPRGEGAPRGGARGFTPRGDAPARPTSFRDVPRATPEGERPRPERGAPRDFKKAGNYRFATSAPSRYVERGGNFTPRSYDEQRRARMGDEPRYDQYRYDAPVQYGAPMDEEADIVPGENLLSGRNPIREALKSGRDIEKLLVQRGELSGSAREIVQMAKERHIPVQEVDRARLDAITHNHQGMLAFASAYHYSTVEDMLALAKERGQAPFLVLLDGITDPHNLGAIIRTAECAGAHGVIVQERRAVGLTPAAVKASAGAVEHVPVARVTNLTNTIEMLKAQNIWIYAADMNGTDYAEADLSGAVALVIGAEGEGVSRRVLENCDKTLSIPLNGKLDSLNASVAAGILLYAVVRAR